jgi:hypothetical protein
VYTFEGFFQVDLDCMPIASPRPKAKPHAYPSFICTLSVIYLHICGKHPLTAHIKPDTKNPGLSHSKRTLNRDSYPHPLMDDLAAFSYDGTESPQMSPLSHL